MNDSVTTPMTTCRSEKGKLRENQNSKKKEKIGTGEASRVELCEHAGMGVLHASINAIHAMKKELNTFHKTIKQDMKEELRNFKEEVHQKL